MYYSNPCRHYMTEITMHGEKDLGCMHPRRKELDRSWFARLLNYFFPHRFRYCEANAGYESYCPFYEEAQRKAYLPPVMQEQEVNAPQRSYTE